MDIAKITVKNFRSIDPEGIEIVSPSKINLLIGRNNCGKSNILRLLKLLGTEKLRSTLPSLNIGGRVQINPGLAIDDHRNYRYALPIQFSLHLQTVSASFKERLMGIIPTEDVYINFQLLKQGSESGSYILESISSFIDDLPESIIRDFETAYSSANGGTRGGSLEDAQRRVNNLLRVNEQFSFPLVEYLDEYRKPIENRDLRLKMNDIVNTDYTNQANTVKKELLCSYFKSVFGVEVDIKIPNIEKEIELVIGGTQYPISSLGAGLQEVVLIAFVLVTTSAELICIDEPELHIHPGAQRELLNLVSTIEGKIFFFATHSNHFLDYEVPDKKIYQLINTSGSTEVSVVGAEGGYRDILDDLGIRASEIYQTNGIIWVEGASDRIYIKKWIELLAPELREGLQYTFQYYGGKVLSHYTLSELENEGYLKILHINHNAYVVMDSDMTKQYKIADLRDTKKRIIKECGEDIGFWVTKGKEIENYLTSRTLTEYSGTTVTRELYRPISEYCEAFIDDTKVTFARNVAEIIELGDFEGNEDLKEKILEIVSKIRSWNT